MASDCPHVPAVQLRAIPVAYMYILVTVNTYNDYARERAATRRKDAGINFHHGGKNVMQYKHQDQYLGFSIRATIRQTT